MEKTQTPASLRKRNCRSTRKYRHAANALMRRWEAPFAEVFGKEWKQWAMVDDGACWQMRWNFFRATIQRSTLRLSSLLEAVRWPRSTRDHLANVEPSPKRRKSEQNQPSDSNLREEETKTTRELAADAVWKEVWTMAPVRSRRQKGGFAALVNSTNVAGWLSGTSKMGDHYVEQTRELLRRTTEALEVRAVHHECEYFASQWSCWISREWSAAVNSLATRAIERKENTFS